MPTWQLVALGIAVFALVYGAFVLLLVLLGRRADARAMATFVPDALVLFRRLLGDPRVRRRHRLLLGVTVVYLAIPIDVVPDFIPVAGQADDVVMVALVLRAVLRGAGRDALREHWPGPERSLDLLAHLAFGRAGRGRPGATAA